VVAGRAIMSTADASSREFISKIFAAAVLLKPNTSGIAQETRRLKSV